MCRYYFILNVFLFCLVLRKLIFRRNLHPTNYYEEFKKGFFTVKQNIKESEKNEMKLFIPQIMIGRDISIYSIATYSALQLLTTSTHMKKQCVTPYQIAFLLTGKDTQTKYTLNYIKCGLEELAKEKIVEKISAQKNHSIIDCSKLWLDSKNGNFTVIYFEEIKKIFKIGNVNCFSLLKYFIQLINTLSGQIEVYVNTDSKTRVVGTYTITKLAELSGISYRALIEYNKLLEENQIIYIHRQNDFVLDGNGIKQLPNVYGRYCDRDFIDAFAENQQKYRKSYQYKEKSTAEVNHNRRLAQMYQQLLKGNEERYSEGEISDIYHYVVAQNKKYELLYEKHNNEDFLDKIRGTDIFDKYEFIREEKRRE